MLSLFDIDETNFQHQKTESEIQIQMKPERC